MAKIKFTATELMPEYHGFDSGDTDEAGRMKAIDVCDGEKFEVSDETASRLLETFPSNFEKIKASKPKEEEKKGKGKGSK